MKDRCYNKKNTGYKWYGGKGIIVCRDWLESFKKFYDDVNIGYNDNLTIDRIDSDGDYCPSNVRWVSQAEQLRNTKQNKIVTIGGETQKLFYWLKHFGIKRSTYGQRVFCYGWSPIKALVTPVRQRKQRKI